MATDPGNQYQAYVKGWAAGAAVRAMDPVFMQGPDDEIRAAYIEAYKTGRAARNDAVHAAAQRFGYTPSVVRLADED